MTMDIHALLRRPDTTIAVVGATDNLTKYGSVIYRDLKRKGYTVYPVNPGRDTVDGDTAYPDLTSLPVTPTIVNMVVPADVGEKVLDEAHELGITNVWVQPGGESPNILSRLSEGGFEYLANACIMVQTRTLA
jgi:predicted CoA-binding protein